MALVFTGLMLSLYGYSFSTLLPLLFLFLIGVTVKKYFWRLPDSKYVLVIIGAYGFAWAAYNLLDFLLKPQFAISPDWGPIYLLLITSITLIFRWSERALNRSLSRDEKEQLYLNLFNHSKGLFIKTNDKLEIEGVNQSLARLVGRDPTGIVGTSLIELFKKGILKTENLISFRENIHFDAEVISDSGEVCYTYWDGKWVSRNELILTGFDITRLRKAEIAEKVAKRKYKILHEGLLDAYVRVDKQGKIVEWNRAYLDLVGYSEEELPNLTYRDITPAQWHIIENGIVEQVLKRGYSDLYEKEYRKKDGTIVPIELRTYLVTDEKGEPDGFWAIIRDISYRKEAEKRVAEAETKTAQSELLFESLLNAIPDVIGVQMPDQTVIFYNEAGYKMLGLKPEDVKGKKCYELINKTKPCEVCATRRVFQSLKPERVEKYISEMGIWLEARSYPVLDNEGNLKYIIEHLHDITDQKNAEQRILETDRRLKEQNEEYLVLNEELSRTNQRIREINEKLMEATERAQESDRLKSAFLANMSHEIRTPMNGIIGFCQLLQQPGIDLNQVATFSKIIVSSSQHLLSIINDIIDISKIEAGMVTLNHRAVSASTIVRGTISLFEISANQKGLRLTNASPIDGDCLFMGDEVKIAQILNNLVNNAIKFTHEGFVEVGFRHDEKYVTFWVKDTGIGIAPENQEMVFERFRQVDGANPGSLKGTGLGLSISRSLVELMGGKIWVESELGKGAAFFFRLPNNPATEGDQEAIAEIETHRDMEIDLRGAKILVAEDDHVNLLLLKRTLEKVNARVIEATNGLQVLDQLRVHGDIALVLMDIKMPEMDGIEATRLLKVKHPDIPVIAQTAYAFLDEQKLAFQAGCDDYVTKPINIDKLFQTIRKWLKN